MYAPRINMVTPKELTFGRFFKFTMLPGILPRLRGLAQSFSRFGFMFVQVFGAAGLIDKHHPCLRPENVGYYRFVDIVGLAFYGVLQDRKNLNKLFMFIMTVGTIVLMMGLLVVSLFMASTYVPAAYAQLFSDYTNADGIYSPQNDLAFGFLGEVFGNTGISVWGGHSETDKHILFSPILRSMFSTYSQALLVIAIIMVIYNIVIMVAESARTGKPFGENFNETWAPLRLALAIGLLAPISGGYNGAQLLSFQVAQWGSALATNVWNKGLDSFIGAGTTPTTITNPDGTTTTHPDAARYAAQKLIYAMQPPQIYGFMRGLFLTETCMVALNMGGGQDGNGWKNLFGTLQGDGMDYSDGDTEGVYNYYSAGTRLTGAAQAGSVIAQTLLFGPGGTINALTSYMNADYCGTYKIPDPDEFQPKLVYTVDGSQGVEIGFLAHEIAKGYQRFYETARDTHVYKASKYLVFTLLNEQQKEIATAIQDSTPGPPDTTIEDVKNLHTNLINLYNSEMGMAMVMDSSGKLNRPGMTNIPVRRYFQDPASPYPAAAMLDGDALLTILRSGKKYGWASAGSVMMTLAHVNNIISSAVNAPPQYTAVPRLLANPVASPYFRNESITSGFFSSAINAIGRFFGFEDDETKVANMNKLLAKSSTWFTDHVLNMDPAGSPQTIAQLNGINIKIWNDQTKDKSADNRTDIDMLSGGDMQSFLLSFVFMNNEDVNPLAQIVAIGAGLFTIASGLMLAAALASIFFAPAIDIALPIAMALTGGAYMLCVVLPISLFMNFMFAVIEWVISVFEAVVGMPLFALSFISVSGEGIGDKAMEGVKMLAEIMLRPAVIVICTVGSMIIFSASVHFFNKTYTLYMLNYFGATSDGFSGVIKNALVVFGSVFMYVLTVYSIGNSCFKIIPTIANQFGRWAGLPGGFSGTMQAEFNQLAGGAAMLGALGTAQATRGAYKGAMKEMQGEQDRQEGRQAQAEQTQLLREIRDRGTGGGGGGAPYTPPGGGGGGPRAGMPYGGTDMNSSVIGGTSMNTRTQGGTGAGFRSSGDSAPNPGAGYGTYQNISSGAGAPAERRPIGFQSSSQQGDQSAGGERSSGNAAMPGGDTVRRPIGFQNQSQQAELSARQKEISDKQNAIAEKMAADRAKADRKNRNQDMVIGGLTGGVGLGIKYGVRGLRNLFKRKKDQE